MNTFQDFLHAAGNDGDRATVASLLVLGDRIAGRPTRPLGEYGDLAGALLRQYGYGQAAAALLAAGWLEHPDYNQSAKRR